MSVAFSLYLFLHDLSSVRSRHDMSTWHCRSRATFYMALCVLTSDVDTCKQKLYKLFIQHFVEYVDFS